MFYHFIYTTNPWLLKDEHELSFFQVVFSHDPRLGGVGSNFKNF